MTSGGLSATAPGAGRKGPPAGWRPRAVVCDVDGTITFKDRHIDPVAIEALRAVEAAGVPVVLATGNVLPIAYALSYLIGTSGPIVAENGGLLYFRGQVTELANRGPVEAVARDVEDALGLTRLFTDRWRVTEVAFPEQEGTFARVRKRVRENPQGGAVRVERTGFAVHLMAQDAEKFTGVERALGLIGLTPADALACGDSDNDTLMVARCGAGAALADAPPGLRAGATLVTKHVSGRGLAEAFATYGLTRGARPAPGARGRPNSGRRTTRTRAARTRRAAPARRPKKARRAGTRAGRR